MIATRPAPDAAPHPASWRDRAAGRAPRLALLACAGLVLEIGWLMVWLLSYHLTHGNDFTYTYLVDHPAVWEKLRDLLVLANTLAPGIEPPRDLDILVNSLVLAFVVAAVGYLAAVLLLDLGIAAAPGALWVVLGFELVYQITLFLLPGLFTTDIFSYVMYGHISAIYGLNPYIYPPSSFPGNELLNWIHPIWHNTPSVYGPLWTDIGWLMAWLIQPLDLLDRVFAYKLLMNSIHLVNLGLVWWLLGRFAPEGGSARARLAAFTTFAWNPLVLFDVPGNAHNDGLMVTLLLLGLVPLVARARPADSRRPPPNPAWLAGLLFVGLSALIKYTTAVVGLFYVVPWARQLPGWRARAAWIGGAGLLLLAITLGLFRPWLQSPAVLSPILDAAGGKLYSNSVPDLAALTVADRLLDPAGLAPDATHELVRFWMKAVTRCIFLVYLAWEARGLWRLGPADRRAVAEAVGAASARAFLVLLLLVLTWVLEWYFIWPLALVTLLGWRRTLTKVVVGYTLTSLPIFYIHHYWSWHMSGGFVLVYAVPPLLLPPVAWLHRAWRRRAAAGAGTPAGWAGTTAPDRASRIA